MKLSPSAAVSCGPPITMALCSGAAAEEVTMAEGDQRDRLGRLWEQQRDALEQAMGRAQRRGRQVAEGMADAVRRITPDTDTRGVLERIESQQREFITLWAEMQRETFDRLLETNEAFWNTVK